MATTRTSSPAADIALIAVFAALIAAFALTPAIPIGAAAVPLTLQTLAVVLTGLVLGAWRGFLATLLYVVVGLAGLPVFAGGAAGLGVLAGPTAGYLLSFPLGAAVAGAVAGYCLRRGFRARYLWLVVAGLACTVVVTSLGIVGMMLTIPWPLPKAFAAALLYLPGDVVKVFAASGIAVAVHKAFPVLLAAPDPRLA
ncbi:MAG TPA: biotin transporter BioY [Propionicimonas sp.]|jgi:biotin transport system substrate-specific component|nr:biotin transporter BioY [Propionicimonas sp.]